MSTEQTNETTNPEYPDQEFALRIADWWNQGAEKAALRHASQDAVETLKREAA